MRNLVRTCRRGDEVNANASCFLPASPKLPIFSNCSFRLMSRREGYKPLGMIAPAPKKLPPPLWHSSLNVTAVRCTSTSPISPLKNLLPILVYSIVCLVIDCPRPSSSSNTLLFPQRALAVLFRLLSTRALKRDDAVSLSQCTAQFHSEAWALQGRMGNSYLPSVPPAQIVSGQSHICQISPSHAQIEQDIIQVLQAVPLRQWRFQLFAQIVLPHDMFIPGRHPCRAYASWELVQNPAICTL